MNTFFPESFLWPERNHKTLYSFHSLLLQMRVFNTFFVFWTPMWMEEPKLCTLSLLWRVLDADLLIWFARRQMWICQNGLQFYLVYTVRYPILNPSNVFFPTVPGSFLPLNWKIWWLLLLTLANSRSQIGFWTERRTTKMESSAKLCPISWIWRWEMIWNVSRRSGMLISHYFCFSMQILYWTHFTFFYDEEITVDFVTTGEWESVDNTQRQLDVEERLWECPRSVKCVNCRGFVPINDSFPQTGLLFDIMFFNAFGFFDNFNCFQYKILISHNTFPRIATWFGVFFTY